MHLFRRRVAPLDESTAVGVDAGIGTCDILSSLAIVFVY
jgi:hypothetical protein